jgi:hypothetical protein
MAENVSSAVVQESVNQILSALLKKYDEKQDSNTNSNLERLEMAHIRLEAALETSENWQILDSSALLRWRRKLKRAAQECGDTLHKCKHQILEKDQIEQEVRNSSLPNRIVHATKSFAFSIFNSSHDELNESTVQRFEWFADGATEFLRFMELGGTPRRHLTFNSLVKHLFAGKGLHYRVVRGKEYPSFLLWLVPYCTAEHGIEVSLLLIHKDNNAPEGNLFYNIVLQLSESTDIVGIAITCLQLMAPHFKCEVENVRNKLAQLPTQDLSWAAPSCYLYPKEHWIGLHNLASQWFRPNPLCCKQHGRHELQRISNPGISSGLSDISLEPVVHVNLQCKVSLSLYNRQKNLLSDDDIFLQHFPYLNAGMLFAPPSLFRRHCK